MVRWIVAVALVSTAHAAAISLTVGDAQPEPDLTAAGAILVELAPTPTTMLSRPETLPIGPPRPETPKAPAVAASENSETPLPEPVLPALPVLATAPPELTIPEQTEKEPEAEIEKQKLEKYQAAQAAQQASTAAAPPPIDGVEAKASSAPVAGVPDKDRRMLAKWQGAVSAHLSRHAHSPKAARRDFKERQARVKFSIDEAGRVLSTTIVASSGSAVFDAEAEAMIRRASPLPLPPGKAANGGLDMVVPVRFTFR